LYNSFIEAVNNKAKVDVFFHYFNIEVFRKLIEENNGSYTKYIICRKYERNGANNKTLPKNDVYILDQTNSDLKEYASVYQNFSKDMFSCLSKAKSYLELYNRLVLIFPGIKNQLVW
jgi:hypothetical protein